MKRVLLCGLLAICSLVITVAAEAKPALKTCQQFAREIESVLKKGDQALSSGDSQAIRYQNKRIADLVTKANRMFVQANACNSAANSASALWTIKLQERNRPTPTGSQWIQRRQQDYRDNMELCKQGFEVSY